MDSSLPKMAARVAAFDWARTPLGPRDTWPTSLRTVVDLVLSSPLAISILWGDELIQIYNDGYALVLGPRHPGALGQPVLSVWPEARAVIEPLSTGVRRGETFSFENQRYVLERHGFPEETYFTYGSSPIWTEGGQVGGVLVTGTETTAQVLAARRTEVLRERAERLGEAQTAGDIGRLVGASGPLPDVPFAALHLGEDRDFPAELGPVAGSRQPLRLDWPAQGAAPRPALALPVDGLEQDQASGVLVLGLNPQVPLDRAYHDFLASYARQVGAALVRVRSQEQAELNWRLEEERAASSAFMAFTRAVGTETDISALARRAVEVLLARYPDGTCVYYEPEGDRWRARVWSDDLRPELLELLRAGLPGTTPFIAQVLGSGQAVFTDRWNPEQQGLEHTGEYGRSAHVPIVLGGEVRGLLGLASRERQPWSERDRALFGAVTQGFTLTLERAEQTRRLDEERVALDAFAAFAEAVGTGTDVPTLIGQAVTLLSQGYGAEAMYHEREGDLFRARVWSPDFPPELLARSRQGFTLAYPAVAQAARERQVVFVDGWETPDQGVEESAVFGAVAFSPFFEGDELVGVLATGLRGRTRWTARERGIVRAVGRGLTLALERAEQTRRLGEEREALAAFARFTELAADTGEVEVLARHAADVLQTALNVRSAVYFERDGDLWRARHVSGALLPQFERHLRAGLPLQAPSLALPAERREPMFFEPWDAAADGVPDLAAYRVAACYPLFPQDHPVGVLGMASTDAPVWTERERAVFRAVGDSFRLALERAASMGQIERQRERLADLNAELGTFIRRTAHNLEAPARRLSHLLDPGRPSDPQALEGLPPYDPVALRDEVTRLKGVARDLRQLSRLEGHPLTREPLALGELFAEVRAGASTTPRSTPLGQQVYWLVGPLPIVRGDRALLRQALDALMTFTLSETRGARYVSVSSREVEGEVQVTVEDDGVGLSGEEAATLFDLVVRTDQEVPVLPGSGLVQVRRVLARHGGWAWAEAQRLSGKVVLAFPRDEAVSELEALFRQDHPGM